MSIKLLSSSGGSVTVDIPTTASNYNLTVPAASGTAMVTGNMPAFYAYMTNGQSISNGTLTNVIFDTKLYDTANCYSTSTGRFTPNVAGYYLFTVNLAWNAPIASGELYGYITKNSTGIPVLDCPGGTNFWCQNVSITLYANGTTDYFYWSVAQNTGSSKSLPGNGTIFQGTLLRAA